MKSFVAGALAGVLSMTLMSMLTLACSGNKQQDIKTAKDTVTLADTACVLVRDVSPSGPANEVCAKEEELKPFINLILGGRKKPAAADAGVAVVADAAASKGAVVAPDASK
jgi:2-keto-4-pentenoate hydratase